MRYILTYFLILVSTQLGFAQTDKTIAFIKLNDDIGYVIDSLENKNCNCIPYVNKKEFRYGVIAQLPDSLVVLKIKLKNNDNFRNVYLTPISYNRLHKAAGFDVKNLNSLYTEEQEKAILKNIAGENTYLLIDYYEINFPDYLERKEKIDFNVDTIKTYMVELYDGSRFIGNIIDKNTTVVILKTSSIPRIEIPIKQIKEMVLIEKENIVAGEYWFPNPNATRYLFSPTAYTLENGEGYYQNTYLLLNSFNVGFGNNVSLGGGFELISTFSAGDPIFYLTPKIGFNISEKIAGAGGILYVTVPGLTSSDNRGSLGILYGIGTYGSIEHNVTGGLGWGFVESEFESRPIITLSAMTRTGKKSGLVTENWFIPSDKYYGIISYGIRFFGEKISVDLAFINNSDIAEGIFIGIPYVDFVVKF